MPFSSSSSVVIKAPVQQVWEAITQPELVKQYFFGTNMDTTWAIGTPIMFRGEWEGKAYEDKGTVLEFNPSKSLAYNYWSPMGKLPDKPELYQVIRFDLEEVSDGTKVTITQSNVQTQESADHSQGNWKMVLDGMKKLVEQK